MGNMTRVNMTSTGKAKVALSAYEQATRQNAMLQQRKVKIRDFPINNRAARRRLKKGFKPGEE